MTHVSDDTITSATGKTWEDWFAILDAAGAHEMTHQQIATWLRDTGYIGQGRWCQGVTIACQGTQG